MNNVYQFRSIADQQRPEIQDQSRGLFSEAQQEVIVERQPSRESSWGGEFQRSISGLVREEVQRLEKQHAGFIKINILPSRILNIPLDAIVEPDSDGYIARTTDLPLYGFGDDSIEAVEALKQEIESLYEDLMEDDKLTPEWLKIKSFLEKCIDNK